MNFVLGAFFYLLFILLFIFIPGKIFSESLKLKGVEKIPAALVFGTFVYSFTAVFVRKLNLDFFWLIILYGVFYLLIFLKFRPKFTLPKLTLQFFLFIFVAATIAFLQGSLLFASGRVVGENVVFETKLEDPLHHLSLISEIKNHTTVENPTIAGEKIVGYHYLADVFIASFLSNFPVSTLDFYFRIYPFFNSFLFSITAFSLASLLLKKQVWKYVLLILMTLGGSFAYFLPLFLPGNDWTFASFKVNNPFEMFFNPQNYLGYSIFLTAIILIYYFDKFKKTYFLFFAVLALGFSFPIKVYVALLGVSGFCAASFYFTAVRKNFKPLLAGVIGILILLAYLQAVPSSKSGLAYVPGWGLNTMMSDPSTLDLSSWQIKIQHFIDRGNYPRVFEYYFFEALIFVFGNLGIRAIGFIYLLFLALKRPFRLSFAETFLLSIFASSFLLPIFYNQRNSPYDIYQFAQYGIIAAAILTPVALEKFKFSKFVNFTLAVLVAALSLPTTLKMIRNLDYPTTVLDGEDLETLEFIKNSTEKDSVFVSLENFDNYVSGIGERRVYINNLNTPNFSYGDLEGRKREKINFFASYDTEKRSRFLKSNNIDYLVIKKEGANFETFKTVFENEKYFVKKVNF